MNEVTALTDSNEYLSRLLTSSAAAKASDIHLRVGAPPFVRVDGRLGRTTAATPLSETQIHAFIMATSGRPAPDFRHDNWEYSFEQTSGVRFRGHAFRESGRWALTLRVVPSQVPNFQDLRLPPVIKTLADAEPGLTLITGPTGSGKSTTAAAMIRAAATSQLLHVITIEDPIEHLLSDVPSCISQREVGRDTPSYAEALTAALREDPDLLFVGEIRDAETLEVALQAAETGHSVLSTFHTGTALKTIMRILAMAKTDDQVALRTRLADALRGIVSQRLLPRKGTKGRVLACEVMINNYSVKECIKDSTKLATLGAVLDRSSNQHMQTFDKHLISLVRDGLITADVACAFATTPNDVRRSLSMQGVEA